MALTISQAGSANSTTSTATLVVTLNQSVSVGDMLVVCVAADNQGGGGAASISSVTDNKSHTYTSRASQNNDPGNAAAGATVAIFSAPITTAMTNTDTVTINFSPNTTSKAAVVWEIVAGATEFPKYLSNGGTTAATANPSLLSSSIGSGDAVIYALAAESNATLTGDSDTTNGNWSTLYTSVANTGTSLTSMTVGSQNKVVTATGTQTWNTTLTAADWGISYIVVDPALRIQRTATGSGTGTETSSRVIKKLRTATGSGVGTQSATYSITPGSVTVSRTATGSGTGTQTATGRTVVIKTATGSGAGTETATGLRKVLRTATGSGVGTQTAVGLTERLRTATGSGAGTQTALGLTKLFRTATGSGTGTQVTVGAPKKMRSATGSGSSSETTLISVYQLRLSALTDFTFPYRFGGRFYLGVRTESRTATGSGVGTETASGVKRSARTATGSGNGSASVSKLLTVIRQGSQSAGIGSSSTTSEVLRVRTAVGGGNGSSSVITLVTRFRSASGEGSGSSSVVKVLISIRTATGSGLGTSVGFGGVLYIRDATGSGTGTSLTDWVKSHIFRVPYTYNYPGGYFAGGDAANRLGRYNRSGVRGRNLYKLTNGEYTIVDQRDLGQVAKLWYGGRDHFLTDAEVEELTAAGFGDSIT